MYDSKTLAVKTDHVMLEARQLKVIQVACRSVYDTPTYPVACRSVYDTPTYPVACRKRGIKCQVFAHHRLQLSQYDFGGVGGTVARESALQGPFCRGFEPRYRRPGLTEGLKA
ncbi:hypothetical protein PoB_001590400 [Plakobranchus ocellatus]|uniref:Uncharacterized protein n=1 Tax=Plakobranchus ocellatus TaxID=259542 RepID=A0AAV3Z251_9GAST|nr:hypothetical protein PoB_001590400 [Plakobranchus ocellatus]